MGKDIEKDMEKAMNDAEDNTDDLSARSRPHDSPDDSSDASLGSSLGDSWIVFAALLARERTLARRERSGLWLAPSFVLLASAVLAFGVSKLSLSSPVLYAANSGFLLCFACMLGLEGWLTRDGERESLTLYALSAQGWLVFVVAKFASFLLLRGVPAVLATTGSVLFYPRLEVSLLAAFSLALPVTLLCATALSAVGLFVATLTLQSRARVENALLLALPLFLPPLLLSMSCLASGLSAASLSSNPLVLNSLALDSLALDFVPSLLLLCGSVFLSLALLPVCALLLGAVSRSRSDEEKP